LQADQPAKQSFKPEMTDEKEVLQRTIKEVADEAGKPRARVTGTEGTQQSTEQS